MKKSGLTHSIGKDNVLPIEFLLMEKERKKERKDEKKVENSLHYYQQK